MKKKAKKIIALIMVLSILSATFIYFATDIFAADGGDLDDNFRWSLSSDGTFTVSGNGYGKDYTNLTVPWYRSKDKIIKVVVDEDVQAIGAYWFSGCRNLVEVKLPSTLIKMGDRVFQNCSSLKNITIPENCCEYYNYIFSGCSALKWAVLPRDNTSSSFAHAVPEYTFNNCSSLKCVWVGSGHTKINNNAFSGCSNLASVVWTGNSLTGIGSNFQSGASMVGTSAIQSYCNSNSKSFINIEGSVSNTLGYSYDIDTMKLTLSGNGAMTSAPWDKWSYFIRDLDIGTPSTICDGAFEDCAYLEGELDIPSSVTSIGASAFDGAGYDHYEIRSQSVTIADSAFTKSNIKFLGFRNNGVYDYVSSKQSAQPDWKYFCLKPHEFNGAGGKCAYCDKVKNEYSLEPEGEHNYIYQYRLGNTLYYKCTHCGEDDYAVSITDLKIDFDNALTTTDSECDTRFDLNLDGKVNGRDFAVLTELSRGGKSKYDMTLTNENATESAKKLYAYLVSTYGEKIISGQQESTWMGSVDYEMNYIHQKTGKYPAIRGLDFMGDDFSGCVSRAKSWANRGGIVSICWHCSKNFDQSYDACKADELTSAELEAVLTKGTPQNTAFLNAMDKAANALRQLQNEGIPVMWRPFHEFDGGWFWWGKGGNEYFKRLWIMMYEHYTYDLGLNNLIWVLGYSHNGSDYGQVLSEWYPGNNYVDIIGADTYEVAQNGAERRLFNPVYDICGGSKPVVMHETGKIPTVEQFKEVPWGYFLTWHTSYITDTDENPPAELNALYNSDYVITLDEVENFYD
ncbi:MAG: leucine-rich repeat protein [Eubacterium sp.]|nr:leucine-rich repeat protein [Eubacterium sp.]